MVENDIVEMIAGMHRISEEVSRIVRVEWAKMAMILVKMEA